MEDGKIIELFWNRDQRAIDETSVKYGGMCVQIAGNILQSKQDAEECVNDTYFELWNVIPPTLPRIFLAFVAKVTRNLALKRIEYLFAKKRTVDVAVSFSELNGCVPKIDYEDVVVNELALRSCMENFLCSLSEQNRYVFLRRYFYFDSVSEIAKKLHVSESAVKSSLLRSRKKLKTVLESSGIYVSQNCTSV